MAMKQPRIPEWRKGEETAAYIRKIVLFLKDFCQEVWRACSEKEMLERIYPVGSIYLCANEENPGASLGGRWERMEEAFESTVSAWKRVS